MQTELKNKIKIAFFDIDGTLTQMGRAEMSDLTMKALQGLKKNGIKIVISSGRVPSHIPVWKGILFDAYIAANGSYCYAGGREIFTCVHDAEDIKILFDNAKHLNVPIQIGTKDGVYTELNDVPKGDAVYQLMVFCPPSDYEKVLQGTKHVLTASWVSHSCDLIPSASGKEIGMQKLLAYFGLSLENAIAFGDGDNDMGMLKAAALGIAMENAGENVKAAADFICRSVDDDGVYYFLKEIELI